MSGFKLYVANTSTIPPDGYLCYEDNISSRGPYPNITQTIHCNTLGKYVIYYDGYGSDEGAHIYQPIVELCYVAIEDNLAYDSLILFNSTANEQASLANDGNLTSCVSTQGSEIRVQVDLKETSIVTEIYITLIGCPPTHYGPFCNKVCPDYCSGPCDLETGNCSFGCVKGWIGDKCELGPLCYEPNSKNLTTNCSPEIYQVYPASGPVNGGTFLTISGNYLGNINDSISIDIGGVKCQNITVTTPYTDETQMTFSLQNHYIACKTGISSEPRNMTQLNVVIDGLTVLTLNETFQYLPDPTFNISTEIPKALQSGGVTFTIRGEGFNNVGSITVERVDNPCDVPEDTSTECETPPRLKNQPNNQRIDVHFDGVTIQFPIEYVEDPTFEMFQGIVLYDKESSIEIEGRSILNVARREDYHINIGLDGICLITDISMDNITCLPPKSVPRTNNIDDNTVHVIVNVIRIKVYIGDLQYKTKTITGNGNTFVMIVGILVAGLVKKTKAATEFKMKIKAKEEIIQKASIEGERIANLRREDGNAYTEPDESVYDEINVEEEKSTRGNSYLDVNEGYDELGQRSPKNPYNQLQQTRDDIQRRDIKNNEMNADDQLQNNKRRNDYLSLFSGYEKPISRNDQQN
ncbi:PLXNA [Mytilus edulis]|uniref:PLXNA n=1 Tax=Mytilus edulis TaxID=6550 RepID=A0A8S3QWX0_MYTED|nr:PLXNA [Mytilus edulis]